VKAELQVGGNQTAFIAGAPPGSDWLDVKAG